MSAPSGGVRPPLLQAFPPRQPVSRPPRHRRFYGCPDQSPQTVLAAAGFWQRKWKCCAGKLDLRKTQDSHLPHRRKGGRGSAAALENVFEPLPSSTIVLVPFHSQLASWLWTTPFRGANALVELSSQFHCFLIRFKSSSPQDRSRVRWHSNVTSHADLPGTPSVHFETPTSKPTQI